MKLSLPCNTIAIPQKKKKKGNFLSFSLFLFYQIMLVASGRETWEGWAFGEGRERRIPTVYSSEFEPSEYIKAKHV